MKFHVCFEGGIFLLTLGVSLFIVLDVYMNCYFLDDIVIGYVCDKYMQHFTMISHDRAAYTSEQGRCTV